MCEEFQEGNRDDTVCKKNKKQESYGWNMNGNVLREIFARKEKMEEDGDEGAGITHGHSQL